MYLYTLSFRLNGQPMLETVEQSLPGFDIAKAKLKRKYKGQRVTKIDLERTDEQ